MQPPRAPAAWCGGRSPHGATRSRSGRLPVARSTRGCGRPSGWTRGGDAHRRRRAPRRGPPPRREGPSSFRVLLLPARAPLVRGAEIALDRGAELGASSPRVPLAFRFGRRDGLLREDPSASLLPQLAEEVLHDAVFARVEADDAQASAGSEDLPGLVERAFEKTKLVVHRDAKRLEDPRGRVDAAPAAK